MPEAGGQAGTIEAYGHLTYGHHVPRKVRDLLRDLSRAGFVEIRGGKGSHRKWVHTRFPGAVTLSGQLGDDAKPYQERQIRQAIERISE